MGYLPLNPKYISRKIKKVIKKAEKLKFDSIAYSGNSGALVAIPVALALNKHLVIIRKAHERSHGTTIEKYNASKRCLIIDDFVESGKTIRRIIKFLKLHNIGIEAVLLYDSASTYDDIDGIKIHRIRG